MTSPEGRIPVEPPRHTPVWAFLSRRLLATEAWLRSHGGARLQHVVRGFWVLIAAVGAFLLVGPVINPPPTLDDITSSASGATDTWIAREFAADYTITRADDGTLHAEVEERIDAFFPDDIDESGIRRVLATQLDRNALEPSAVEAMIDGRAVEVAQSASADRLSLELDAGQRLSGDHAFLLRYEIENLAHPSTDEGTGDDVDLLEWDVFGPSWPQGFSGLEVSVTLDDELDAELVRAPRGSLAWTLLGAGDWLEPEPDSPAGQVRYEFANDQNIPPNAQAWFTFVFEPGTFTMPPPSTLFYVQSFGPLAPLALLAVTLLFAVAARRVAWSDERGRPWIIAQHDPPEGVRPALAAHVLRAPRALELAVALDGIPRRGQNSRTRRVAAARVARRTGRLGDIPRALFAYLRGPERRQQLSEGLRRIPRGFVLDFFVGAPIALTVVQWALVRQISEQVPVGDVWWPLAFVTVSTVLAGVVLALGLTARPLTEKGALVRQHLEGIRLYAERTSMLERTQASDDLLPYAVLQVPPRTAGRRMESLVEAELGDRDASDGWARDGYITVARAAVLALATGLLAAAIAVVALVPNPYLDPASDHLTRYTGVPGTSSTDFRSIETVGELTRTEEGRAEIRVRERLDVVVEEGSSRVPQIARQWVDTVDGHDLDLTVEAVRLDGASVPHVIEPDLDTVLMRTAFAEPISGDHVLEIDYTIGSAAVVAEEGDDVVDRVRWAGLADDWNSYSGWRGDTVDPQVVEFRISDELAGLAETSGWLSLDPDGADQVRDWPSTVVSFGGVDDLGTPSNAIRTTEQHDTEGATEIHRLELRENASGGYPFELDLDGVGVRYDFPAGTFTGPDPAELQQHRLLEMLPLTAHTAMVLVAVGVGALAMLRRLMTGRPPTRPAVRDAVRLLPPAAALATLVLFFGMAAPMPGDHPAFALWGWPALAAIVGGVLGPVAARRE